MQKNIRNSPIELRAVEAQSMADLLGVQLSTNDSDSQVLGKIGDALRAQGQALADVRTLIAWRKQAPMIRQWVVGSRFAQVHCCLQEQGEDVVAPFYGTDEADAMAKAAAWVRESGPRTVAFYEGCSECDGRAVDAAPATHSTARRR